MRVLFVRHAEADELGHGIPGEDEKRPLTRKGRRQCEKLAAALEVLELKPRLILSSPLVRASETAEILSQNLKRAPEPIKTRSLLPAASWSDLKREIARHGDVLAGKRAKAAVVIVVGHQPNLAEMVAVALTGMVSEFKIAKGGCVGLEWNDDKPLGDADLFIALNEVMIAQLI